MIQKQERRLEKGYSSGMIPERIGKILVVINFQESSNSSIWDELNFENSRYTTVSLSHLGQKTEEFSQKGNMTYKGRKITKISKEDGK